MAILTEGEKEFTDFFTEDEMAKELSEDEPEEMESKATSQEEEKEPGFFLQKMNRKR